MNCLILFVLIAFVYCIFAMDLSSEIIKTLENDHQRMSNFKENYRRMSCKLLTVSKMRALYESEELDIYTNRTTPEMRPKYVDKLKDAYLENCLKLYREDKILFEKELFYSFPKDDGSYKWLLKVDKEALLEGFPFFNSTEWDLQNRKNKTETKKNRKGRYEEDPAAAAVNNNSTEVKKDDL